MVRSGVGVPRTLAVELDPDTVHPIGLISSEPDNPDRSLPGRGYSAGPGSNTQHVLSGLDSLQIKLHPGIVNLAMLASVDPISQSSLNLALST
jgi:hypothetical protein